MVNSCLDPHPGRIESSGRNIGQNHSIGNVYNYFLFFETDIREKHAVDVITYAHFISFLIMLVKDLEG